MNPALISCEATMASSSVFRSCPGLSRKGMASIGLLEGLTIGIELIIQFNAAKIT
jgi:hypothetical protein